MKIEIPSFKVFRYSFSEAIPIFFKGLKMFFSLSDRYKFFTSNWLWIEINSLSSLKFFGIFDYGTLKNDISAVIYSTISSYTSLERTKIKLSEKKYFGLRKPIIFRTKKNN